MKQRNAGTLLMISAFAVLAIGIAIVVWGITPRVFPECNATTDICDPTGHPIADERIPLRLGILGIATAITVGLALAGRALREGASLSS
jgi:hypothetical protein